MHKSSAINKRKKKIRCTIKKQNKYRLTVYKSNKHIYTQLYNSTGTKIITSLSTLDNLFKNEITNTKTTEQLTKTTKAKIIGLLLAKKIKDKNITQVVFDRSGFKFHGRIKAVADSIKDSGIAC
ncbi:MAG TPA: 50S ribosomal protein L18 [Candidatus Azoamicus sp. OHIO2]